MATKVQRGIKEDVEVIPGIYFGERGNLFKTKIIEVLKMSGIKEKLITVLTDDSSMEIYSAAFTSELVDEKNNYQVYEQLGDLAANKAMVQYFYKKFPRLSCAEGVKIVARLRINYGSKQSFFQIAKGLGFWNFITAPNELRQHKMKPLLEDSLESFIGATEKILDDRVKMGFGFINVYKILAKIFDGLNISLRYEDLYDSKTRLKELFDMYGNELGLLLYKEIKTDTIIKSTVYRRYGTKEIKLGEGSASLKCDAQQKAATEAITKLNNEGYIKTVPEIYSYFCGEIESLTHQNVRERLGPNTIDTLFQTKDKSRYQCKYLSTLLGAACRNRDKINVRECLKMRANINIEDSDGLTPCDLLFIGKVEEPVVKSILKRMSRKGDVTMHENVYNIYYVKYTDPFFKTVNITKIR